MELRGPAIWDAVWRSVAGSFLLFDNCIWFFWKLIVLSYLWMAGAGLCFCVFLPCCDEWRGGMRGRRLGVCFIWGMRSGCCGLVLGYLWLAEKYLVRVLEPLEVRLGVAVGPFGVLW